ncbi:MAG: methyl-accepting chemotaxis protein, partial [Lachnospiraceae bacterium]
SGTEAMRTLLDQVEVAIVSGKEMKDSAEKLQGMTKEVRDIISIILSISSQTNLLALNASIEAARAGEAGRGFAVVADEIRNLADQTKESTEKISTILDELTKDSQHVVDKVEESVDLSAKQTSLAEIANREFNHIKEMVEKVITDMEEIERKIQQLTSANKVISENVTTLSASTQEISASTVSTYEESQKNVELVDGFENALQVILDEIYALSRIK